MSSEDEESKPVTNTKNAVADLAYATDPGLALYRMMALIRRFEEVAQALFQRGAIPGSIHLCMGQEAVPTGVCSVLEPGDVVAATYRGHGQALALGTDPLGLMAELLGRENGVCGGRAGSMNVVDRAHGLLGCFGIVGGSIAAATGAALTFKLKQTGGVAVAFFGDGATNHGYFFECLNFAAVNALPVVYVCENNLYGEFTPMADVTAGGILARPEGMGIRSEQVDGNDVFGVRDAAIRAVEHARSSGPSFIEALTYRYNDHSRGDPVDYRRPGEMEEWKARDPLILARAALQAVGTSLESIEMADASVGSEVEDVRAAAVDSPLPAGVGSASEFKGA
jgi:acetoin:2,6-dichlorophenolindophenol oxidoreductase subunit alpha